MQRCAILCLTILLPLNSLRAEDWPSFRGPTGDGVAHAGTAPLEWGPKRNLTWKQTIPGKGWSSPVIVDGRVYLTSAVGTSTAGESKGSLELKAFCLDAGSGKILWEKALFTEPASAPRIHSKNSHASPTPIVHEGKLYVHFGHMGTACLDLDGKEVWKNNTITYKPVHGNGGSPIIVDDKLIFSCDGGEKPFILALSRETGKVVWKTERNTKASRTFSFSTPTLITVKDQKQIISPASEAVIAYDPATGKEIWRVRYPDGYSVIPKPVFGHGLLFVSSGYNTPTLYAIRPDGKGDVTETHVAWKTNKFAPHTPSPLLVGDELYLASDAGQVSCLDARTGEVRWQERLTGCKFSASPITIDGKIYLQSEEGVGTVLKAGKEFKQLARNPLDEKSLASAAVVDGALFIRTETNLYCFQAGKTP